MSVPTITWKNWSGKELSLPLPQTLEEYEHLLRNKSYLWAASHSEESVLALHSAIGKKLMKQTLNTWRPRHTQKMNMAIVKLTNAGESDGRYLERVEDGWPPAAPAAGAVQAKIQELKASRSTTANC